MFDIFQQPINLQETKKRFSQPQLWNSYYKSKYSKLNQKRKDNNFVITINSEKYLNLSFEEYSSIKNNGRYID